MFPKSSTFLYVGSRFNERKVTIFFDKKKNYFFTSDETQRLNSSAELKST